MIAQFNHGSAHKTIFLSNVALAKKYFSSCVSNCLFGIRGAIRVVPQWGIRHRRKRGERVNRNEQRAEVSPRGRLRRLRLRGRAAEIPQKNHLITQVIFLESGGDLLSRAVTSQVPSALKSLTSVFGMGTSGTSSSLPPEMVQCPCAH